MSRRIEDLTPEMQEKAAAFSNAMAIAGIDFIFTQTRRTVDEQAAYYAQGREDLDAVNAKRKIAGMAPITEKENKLVVTHTMQSNHLTGEAFDIAIKVNGKIQWVSSLYDKAGEIGESVGLVWGGRWAGKKRDKPHYELKKEV
jgi:peptidoglycan L-alanyl-D-glutamate endopeptidase CwlK